jgi:hypothetical protein
LGKSTRTRKFFLTQYGTPPMSPYIEVGKIQRSLSFPFPFDAFIIIMILQNIDIPMSFLPTTGFTKD